MRVKVALVLLALLTAAGCQGNKQKRIAVIPKSTSSVFWIAVEQGAREAGKEFGVEILWNGPPEETQYSRQVQIIDSMIAQRVDGIALAAAERKALVAPVDRAAALGIPVTVFDSGLDSTNYVSYVATDNLDGGRQAARALAKLLNNKGNVGMVMHAPGSASTMDREKGFTEVIAKEFPEIKIVATQYGMSDRAKARSATENILTAHPALHGLFASSEPSSVGAALAVKSRTLSGKVKLVAFDSSDGLIQDMREDTVSAMVVQDPHKMGYEAVKAVYDKISGKTPPKQLDLSARVVLKEDLARPEIKQLLMIK